MTGNSMSREEQEETLFHLYPCGYYVQSPSTVSQANTTIPDYPAAILHSPKTAETREDYRLSTTNSSRGSNHLVFLHDKRLAKESAEDDYDDEHDGDHDAGYDGEKNAMVIHVGSHQRKKLDRDYNEEDDDEVYRMNSYYYSDEEQSCWRFLSFKTSSSNAWVALQVSWRLIVSLAAAFLIFYLATKPPTPTLSLQVGGIPEFELGEGVDASGVTTKLLTLNCTLGVFIDNKSKLFALHLHPPLMSIFFSNHLFAISYGPGSYAEAYGRTVFELHVGMRSRAMYGAGSSMEELLESGKGVPLVIHISFSSSFHVVGDFIKPRFHHRARCYLLITNAYDKKHRTQAFRSNCLLGS